MQKPLERVVFIALPVNKFIRSMSTATYLFFQPLNFESFVSDTDDLSTLRGSYMTLLRAPDLLLAWLQDQVDAVDLLQNAASELLVRLTSSPVAHSIEGLQPEAFSTPDECDGDEWKRAWNKLRNLKSIKTAASNGTLADELLLAEATNVARKRKLPEDSVARLAAQVKHNKTQVKAAEALSDDTIKNLTVKAWAFLGGEHGGFPLDLMSFGLEIMTLPIAYDVLKVRSVLESRLRQSQFRRFTVPIVPSEAPIDSGNGVCRLTGVLPATRKDHLDRPISSSVARRRRVGLRSKSDFYLKELRKAQTLLENGPEHSKSHLEAALKTVGNTAAIGEAIESLSSGALQGGFVSDFQQMVQAPPEHAAVSVKSGIAVISMDGNSFGKIREQAVKKEPQNGLPLFATWLELRKALLLAGLIRWIAEDPTTRMVQKKAAFEVLMWGGDEFEFVLPAWNGWDLACYLSRHLADWSNPVTQKPLSFGIGIAFGKAKTPIRILRGAAQGLASKSKRVSRTETLFQFEAYESVDTMAMDPSVYRSQMYGENLHDSNFALSAQSVLNARDRARHVYRNVGTSGLLRWMTENRAEFAKLGKSEEAAKALNEKLMYNLSRVSRSACLDPQILVAHGSQPSAKPIALAHSLLLRDYICGAERVMS